MQNFLLFESVHEQTKGRFGSTAEAKCLFKGKKGKL